MDLPQLYYNAYSYFDNCILLAKHIIIMSQHRAESTREQPDRRVKHFKRNTNGNCPDLNQHVALKVEAGRNEKGKRRGNASKEAPAGSPEPSRKKRKVPPSPGQLENADDANATLKVRSRRNPKRDRQKRPEPPPIDAKCEPDATILRTPSRSRSTKHKSPHFEGGPVRNARPPTLAHQTVKGNLRNSELPDAPLAEMSRAPQESTASRFRSTKLKSGHFERCQVDVMEPMPLLKKAKGNALTEEVTAPSSDEPHLIQESLAESLYGLIVQAILWNQTTGKQARPVLHRIMKDFPTPNDLAKAENDGLVDILYPIGLYNSRAKRLKDLGQAWCERPPVPGKGYTRARGRYMFVPAPAPGEEGNQDDKENPSKKDRKALVKDVKGAEPVFGHWEIAHLPGVGPYCLDSFRIFYRDKMRELAEDWLGKGAGVNFEPEWKRVVPMDKDLRRYVKWLWKNEGFDYDIDTGQRRLLNESSAKPTENTATKDAEGTKEPKEEDTNFPRSRQSFKEKKRNR